MKEEVYFKDIQKRLFNEIESANDNIKIAVAWFTDSLLFNLLLKKAKAGIQIQLISVDDEINQKSKINFKDLASAGGAVFLIRDKLMHNKFCIIDNSTLINGSYNWSNKAQSNYENIMISRNSYELIRNFEDEFSRIISYASIVLDGRAFKEQKVSIEEEETDAILDESIEFALENTEENLKRLYNETGLPNAALTHSSFALSCLEQNLKNCSPKLSKEEKLMFLLHSYPTSESYSLNARELTKDENNYISNTYQMLISEYSDASFIKNSTDKILTIKMLGLIGSFKGEAVQNILREQYAKLVFQLFLPIKTESSTNNKTSKKPGCFAFIALLIASISIVLFLN